MVLTSPFLTKGIWCIISKLDVLHSTKGGEGGVEKKAEPIVAGGLGLKNSEQRSLFSFLGLGSGLSLVRDHYYCGGRVARQFKQ